MVPEVVQTSNMDCGPAALKCLLEGFGIGVNYGRLREACQTDVDGTSIDTMEEVANQLGVDAEQIMLPADHVLLDEARALPAIAVILLPSGITHFVVVWSRHGRFVQLMDPATGRRWTQCARFLSDLYIHKMVVLAEDWRTYASSEDFLGPLRRRMADVGVLEFSEPLLSAATSDGGWQKIAALDAGIRLLKSIVSSGAIDRGAQADRVLQSFLENADTIPEHYWSVRARPAEAQLLLRGAVLVRALGRSTRSEHAGPTSPELIAALTQPATQPGRELLRLLSKDGLFTPSAIIAALALASGAVIIEAMLFRGLIDVNRLLGLAGERRVAMFALIVFSLVLRN
jgi:predicted double-glycine peptidase